MLDLACGTGEMLCTWARDYQVTGTGIDISTAFIAAARAGAIELGADDQVRFVHGDASGHVASEPAGIASCIGATWIGGGVPGTVDLLRQSLQPGGVMLIGEPYWRQEPRETCHRPAEQVANVRLEVQINASREPPGLANHDELTLPRRQATNAQAAGGRETLAGGGGR